MNLVMKERMTDFTRIAREIVSAHTLTVTGKDELVQAVAKGLGEADGAGYARGVGAAAEVVRVKASWLSNSATASIYALLPERRGGEE